MGLITRIRALKGLVDLYGLRGEDHPPPSLNTRSSIPIVHDISREVELSPDPGNIYSTVMIGGGLSAAGAGTNWGQFKIDPAGLSGMPPAMGAIDTSKFDPWLIGLGAWVVTSGNWNDTRVALLRYAVPDGAYGATPEVVLHGTAFTAVGTGIWAFNALLPDYKARLPIRLQWGDYVLMRAISTAADTLWVQALVHLTPKGVGTYGAR